MAENPAKAEHERLTARIPAIEARIAEMRHPDFEHSPVTEAERNDLEAELRRAQDDRAQLESIRGTWDRD